MLWVLKEPSQCHENPKHILKLMEYVITVYYYNKLHKLEDLKVLMRSPDFGSQDLNNVKLGQGQSRLIILQYFVLRSSLGFKGLAFSEVF